MRHNESARVVSSGLNFTIQSGLFRTLAEQFRPPEQRQFSGNMIKPGGLGIQGIDRIVSQDNGGIIEGGGRCDIYHSKTVVADLLYN